MPGGGRMPWTLFFVPVPKWSDGTPADGITTNEPRAGGARCRTGLCICVRRGAPARLRSRGRDAPSPVARFEGDHLVLPADYRAWAFVTSGIDMSYSEAAKAMGAGHSTFDNVFANPVAYRAFMATGALA